MAVTLATVAYAFSTAVTGADGAVSLPGNNGVIALVAANLYVIFFNMSWGPIMWVMLGEMFPNQIRGSGLAVAGFAQWIANAAVSVSFPALAVSPGLAVFQQLVGINVVFYYGAVLWQAVGFSEADALKINILTGAVSIAACLVSIALVDRLGRRPLLLIGSLGMTVTLGILAWSFAQATIVDGHVSLPPGIGTTALFAANAYVVFFNLSWGPVMWVMLGEMFPNQMRGSALAIAGAAQWLANFAVSSSFPWMAKNIGLPVTYTAYTVSALVSFVFVLRWVRETKGVELEAMEG
jgi:SP family sugar:H+ symporter-like MFS transporter